LRHGRFSLPRAYRTISPRSSSPWPIHWRHTANTCRRTTRLSPARRPSRRR
jgi:hypothetical protein